MSLRYGILPVNPERRICINCQHFHKEPDPHSGWGHCEIGLKGKLFRNHTKHGSYMAYHTNARYYTQKGCKVRFRNKAETV